MKCDLYKVVVHILTAGRRIIFYRVAVGKSVHDSFCGTPSHRIVVQMKAQLPNVWVICQVPAQRDGYDGGAGGDIYAG